MIQSQEQQILILICGIHLARQAGLFRLPGCCFSSKPPTTSQYSHKNLHSLSLSLSLLNSNLWACHSAHLNNWYSSKNPSSLSCPTTHSKVLSMRYGTYHALKTFSNIWAWYSLKNPSNLSCPTTHSNVLSTRHQTFHALKTFPKFWAWYSS